MPVLQSNDQSLPANHSATTACSWKHHTIWSAYELVQVKTDTRTIVSTTLFSSNSGGILIPWATAARTCPTQYEKCKVYFVNNRLTVSITPDALGFPSIRMGAPPMYFEIILSNGSRVWLYVEAAAVVFVLISQDRDTSKRGQTLRESRKKYFQPLASDRIGDKIFVFTVPWRHNVTVRYVNIMAATYLTYSAGTTFGWHLVDGYSPWIICCRDSTVLGIFVDRKRTWASCWRLSGRKPSLLDDRLGPLICQNSLTFQRRGLAEQLHNYTWSRKISRVDSLDPRKCLHVFRRPSVLPRGYRMRSIQ